MDKNVFFFPFFREGGGGAFRIGGSLKRVPLPPEKNRWRDLPRLHVFGEACWRLSANDLRGKKKRNCSIELVTYLA